MKKTIRDFDLNGKKVIIRVDFNVPIKDKVITDDNRIKESLETINYAIENGAKVILLSHLGRVKTEEDKNSKSLEPISKRLSELLNKDVIFSKETKGNNLEILISSMKQGDVLLIENTRFEDLNGKKESSNDPELGKYWSSLGDVFINDAFGTSHRAHASNVGIASHLPSGIGFLVEKELENLSKSINNPKRPLTIILGGSKVSDKIGVIKNLVNIADYILIGGGMAFTFLAAEKISVGSSIMDIDNLDFCTEVLDKNPNKIVLPIDVVTGEMIDDNTNSREVFINEIRSNEMGLDIGPLTIKLFKQYIDDSKTIIWNGPVGVFEIDKFSYGTKKLSEIIADTDATTIIGGGDTVSAITKFGLKEKFTHVSTGGGASLEFLEGKALPGIVVINDK